MKILGGKSTSDLESCFGSENFTFRISLKWMYCTASIEVLKNLLMHDVDVGVERKVSNSSALFALTK